MIELNFRSDIKFCFLLLKNFNNFVAKKHYFNFLITIIIIINLVDHQTILEQKKFCRIYPTKRKKSINIPSIITEFFFFSLSWFFRLFVSLRNKSLSFLISFYLTPFYRLIIFFITLVILPTFSHRNFPPTKKNVIRFRFCSIEFLFSQK